MPTTKYDQILGLLDKWVRSEVSDFPKMSRDVEKVLSKLDRNELISVVEQVGVIPEVYDHDSTHEKLYAKMSDCVIAFIFAQLGFETKVLTERADSADVICRSRHHRYEFVADAKVFRLSRTAKNQKDFKINSMDKWRGDAEYSVLVCPLYQYPNTNSAIYSQVLDTGVALSSFEHLLFCLTHNVSETKKTSLAGLFTYPGKVSETVQHASRKSAKPIFDALDSVVAELAGKTVADLKDFQQCCLTTVSERAKREKTYWEGVIDEIGTMTLKQAREALIESRKIRSKIASISEYILPE
jgi:hypothetical protein